MTYVRGLDLGEDQGVVTLSDMRELVAEGVRFLIIRCCEGAKPAVDPRFAPNVAAARVCGTLAIAPYFVPHFGPGIDPLAQADLHWTWARGVGAKPGDLRPMVDFEVPDPSKWAADGVTGASLVADCVGYLTRLSVLCGRAPVLYTYEFFARQLAAGGGSLDLLAPYPLALAGGPYYEARPKVPWPPDDAAPPTLAPWGEPALWQVSDGGGKLPNGCPVDTEVCSPEALARLTA